VKRHPGHPKRWHPTTTPPSATAQKTPTRISTPNTEILWKIISVRLLVKEVKLSLCFTKPYVMFENTSRHKDIWGVEV
jgi:hypothetical protein